MHGEVFDSRQSWLTRSGLFPWGVLTDRSDSTLSFYGLIGRRRYVIIEAMTHSGSNCNSGGSFVSACDDEKRRPSHLSSISFGTGMHIHKKGQRPIFRGVKRKKALYEASERVPIRRCVLLLEPHISLSRKREALMDDNGLEGELNGRDKNHAVVNGSVNDGNSGTLPLSLQIPGPPIVLQTNFSEMSNSQAGSECFEMLKLEEPDERSQGTPRSVFSPNSPFLTTVSPGVLLLYTILL